MYDDFPGVDRAWNTRHILATPRVVEIQTRVHQNYSFPSVDIIEWALERVPWRGDEHVLDVGGGAGVYIDAVQRRIPDGQLVVSDLSMELLRQLRGRDETYTQVTSDLQALPFASGTFDMIIAGHILHQVPDIGAGLREIRRVLRPDGVMLATSNASYQFLRLGGHVLQVDELYRRVFALMGIPAEEPLPLRPLTYRFCMDNGIGILSQHFYAVARHDLPLMLAFPGLDEVIEYLVSTRSSHEPNLPNSITWDAFMRELTDQLDQIIDYFGELEIGKMVNLFVASNIRDFAALPRIV
jgi:SAM-dependent methyltransferase